MAREKALTSYVQHLIREWERSGKTLVDLERASGARSSGHFSQIKSGKLGASQRVAEYIAKALHKTPTQLRIEADEFYAKHGEESEKLKSDDPEIARAIEAAKSVAVAFGITLDEHVIKRALERWKDQVGQPSAWWMEKFAEESRLETVEQRGAVRAHRKQKRILAGKRRRIREVGEEKRKPASPPALPAKVKGA